MPPTDAELQRRAENRLLAPVLELTVLVAQTGLRMVPRVDPPAGLKPFLGFTNRVPSAALRAARHVLDNDHVFRERVATAVTDELVGEAGVLFAERDEGWSVRFAELVAVEMAEDRSTDGGNTRDAKKLAAVTETLQRTERSLSEARSEITTLKATLQTERRERSAVSKQLERIKVELATAIDRVSALHEEIELAQKQSDAALVARDIAEAEVMSLQREMASSLSQSEAILQARVAVDALRLAFDVAAPSRPGHANPASVSVENVRHGGSSKEKDKRALGQATQKPQRTVPAHRRALRLPMGMLDDSVEAAQYLLRYPNVVVLVDAYNVAKLRWGNDVTPSLLRERLLAMATQLAQRTSARIVLVFDGKFEGMSSGAHGTGVAIEFTARGQEADDRVIELVGEQRDDVAVVVVSSDRRVTDGSLALGANVLAASAFIRAWGSAGPTRR